MTEKHTARLLLGNEEVATFAIVKRRGFPEKIKRMLHDYVHRIDISQLWDIEKNSVEMAERMHNSEQFDAIASALANLQLKVELDANHQPTSKPQLLRADALPDLLWHDIALGLRLEKGKLKINIPDIVLMLNDQPLFTWQMDASISGEKRLSTHLERLDTQAKLLPAPPTESPP